MWTPFGHDRAVGAPYLNARALGLNGQAILYFPPGTGKTQAHRVVDPEETGGRAQRVSSCASSRATLEGYDL